MKLFKINTMLRKIFLSYLALLLIPTLLFFIMVSIFYNKYITQNVLSEQTLLAEKTIDNISAHFSTINRTTENILKNQIFYPYFSNNIPASFVDIRDFLSKSQSEFNIETKIYYCNMINGEVHSSEGMYKTNSPVDNLLKECTYLNKRTIVRADNNVNFFIPIEYTNNNTVKSAIVFTTQNSYFESALSYSSVYENVTSIVRNVSEIVYTVNDSGGDYDNPYKYMHITAQAGLNCKIDRYIPINEIRENHFYPIWMFILLVVIMAVICVIIVSITVKRIYVPWQKSIHRLQEFFKRECETPRQIDDSILELIKNNETNIKEKSRIKNEYALFRVLSEASSHDLGAIERVKEYLPGPSYLCMTAGLNICTKFADEVKIPYASVNINQKASCIVFSNGKNVLKDLIEKMPLLADRYGVKNIGIGSIADNIGLLRESYINSKIAFDISLKSGDAVTVSDDTVKSGKFIYPYEIMSELDTMFLRRNAEMVKHLTEKLQTLIAQTSNRFAVCCVFQEYLKIVSSGLASLQIDGFDEIEMRDSYYKSSGVSIDSVLHNMAAVCALAEKLMVAESSSARQIVTAQTMIDYIKRNYLDPNFSLKAMSFDLQVSPSNASHIFKKETSITLTEYIDNLKIEFSKELLAKPGSSVNEVSTSLGFANPSTFIKKFRAIEGMTPGAYKSQL